MKEPKTITELRDHVTKGQPSHAIPLTHTEHLLCTCALVSLGDTIMNKKDPSLQEVPQST